MSMDCDCITCKGKDVNMEGIRVATEEVLPFVKQDLLKLRYPNHPLPFRYDGWLASLFAFSQAVRHNRAHNVTNVVYYTDNKWMLKYSTELATKFGMEIRPHSDAPAHARNVCEYNPGE